MRLNKDSLRQHKVVASIKVSMLNFFITLKSSIYLINEHVDTPIFILNLKLDAKMMTKPLINIETKPQSKWTREHLISSFIHYKILWTTSKAKAKKENRPTHFLFSLLDNSHFTPSKIRILCLCSWASSTREIK